MKILVVSDTHGIDTNLKQVLSRHADLDALIHLGDFEHSREYIHHLVHSAAKKGRETEIYMVRGNCDYGSDIPAQRVETLEGHRLFMTHGHRYDISYGDLTRLVYKAEEERCEIVLFGHIHQPVMKMIPGRENGDPELLVLNPGSLSRPRQEGYRPSYMILELESDSRPRPSLQYI